jgi:hypothetical protein
LSDSVGSVSVDVVPDARGWAEKLRAQIRDQTVKVQAEADTTEANAKLDEAARTRTAKINVDVDKSALSRFDSFLGGMSALPALAIAGASALVPLAATLGGVALALGAPLVIAGGGATLFAFLGGLAAKDTEAKLKNIAKLQQHLATLTKGTKEYKVAQQQLHDAQAALTPEQQKFADAQAGLVGAFQKFLEGKSGRTLLDVMAQGMTVLAHLLPVVAPVITTVGGAISSLLSDIDKAAQSQGFGHVVDQFARLAGRDIRIGAHILGEVAKGIGGLLLSTDRGFSGSFLHGLDHLSSSFADWANSKAARHDMREFFGYVHDVGPQVAHTIGAIASALGKVVEALAPLAPVVLKGIEGVASGLSAIPIPVLTALAAASVGLVGFQKVGGFKALGALGRLGGGSAGGSVIERLTGGAVQKVFVVNMPPGGIGGGGVGGQASRFGKYAPIAAGAGQGGLLGLFAAFDVWAGNRIVHQVAKSESQYAFGHAAPTVGADETPWQIAHGPHLNYGKLMMEANGSLTSITNHWDAVKAHAASASRQIDMVGPHAANSFGQADKALDGFRLKLAAMHDKQLRIILQDEAAVRELERIQAMRLDDKHLNMYARYQGIERTPGPGGGMGQLPHGSGGGGSGSGAGRAGPTYTGDINVKAQDYRDFIQQMEARHRRSSLDGVG